VLLKQADKKKAEINIIPMVDIVFQLIIFFLVAMQVKENKVTKLNLPRARWGGKVAEKESALIINVVSPERAGGRPYRVLLHKFSLKELNRYLQGELALRERQKKKMPAARIRADMNAEFKNIQEALIACRNAHIWKIRVTTKKPTN